MSSAILNTLRLNGSRSQGPLVTMRTMASGTVSGLVNWAARARQRSQLRELDPRLLRDIGLTRGDALVEAKKPFWKE